MAAKRIHTQVSHLVRGTCPQLGMSQNANIGSCAHQLAGAPLLDLRALGNNCSLSALDVVGCLFMLHLPGPQLKSTVTKHMI